MNEKYDSIIDEMEARYERAIAIRDKKLAEINAEVTTQQWLKAFSVMKHHEAEIEMRRCQCAGAEIAFRKLSNLRD